MSAATKAEARIHEVDEAEESQGNDVAAPLDLLLADATSSPLRRFLPGMSGVRFSTSVIVSVSFVTFCPTRSAGA